jgi:hypothetical protein
MLLEIVLPLDLHHNHAQNRNLCQELEALARQNTKYQTVKVKLVPVTSCLSTCPYRSSEKLAEFHHPMVRGIVSPMIGDYQEDVAGATKSPQSGAVHPRPSQNANFARIHNSDLTGA